MDNKLLWSKRVWLGKKVELDAASAEVSLWKYSTGPTVELALRIKQGDDSLWYDETDTQKIANLVKFLTTTITEFDREATKQAQK